MTFNVGDRITVVMDDEAGLHDLCDDPSDLIGQVGTILDIGPQRKAGKYYRISLDEYPGIHFEAAEHELLAGPHEFKVGDRIKVTASYPGGQWSAVHQRSGQYADIIKHNADVRNWPYEVRFDDGATLDLSADEMEYAGLRFKEVFQQPEDDQPEDEPLAFGFVLQEAWERTQEAAAWTDNDDLHKGILAMIPALLTDPRAEEMIRELFDPALSHRVS